MKMRMQVLGLSMLPLLICTSAIADPVAASDALKLAGEIIVDKSAPAGRGNAKSNQSNARAMSEKESSLSEADLEDGVLSPRGGAPAESMEYEMKARELMRQQETERRANQTGFFIQLPNGVIVPAPEGYYPSGPTNQERAIELKDKARSYVGEPRKLQDSRFQTPR